MTILVISYKSIDDITNIVYNIIKEIADEADTRCD